MISPTTIINLKHLQHNIKYLKSLCGSTQLYPVIKADAYGHGILPISKVLSELGMYGFCVALASEVQELIDGGINNPILHLGKLSEDQLHI